MSKQANRETKVEARARLLATGGEELAAAFDAAYTRLRVDHDPISAWHLIRRRKEWFPDAPEEGFERIGMLKVPREWGELPRTAKWDDEVEWVHQNFAVCRVSKRGKGASGMDLMKASRPPSHGALALLQMAVANPQAFQTNIVAKVKRGEGGEEEEGHRRRERVAIEEIRRLLEQFREEGDGRFELGGVRTAVGGGQPAMAGSGA